MALTEGELVTSYGLTIRKAGKNFVCIGGSKAMEYADAVHEYGDLAAGIGKGPDNFGNADGAHEDDLKDAEFVEEFGTRTFEKSDGDIPETDAGASFFF
jgi:hypothetical protein